MKFPDISNVADAPSRGIDTDGEANSFASLLRSEGGGSAEQGGAASSGDPLQDAAEAMQQFDPTLYAKTVKDAKDGDGNALVEDELQAYKEGAITQDQAKSLVSGAQSEANAHGGGKINGQTKKDAEGALGADLIKGGHTRAAQAIINGLESFTGIGAIVKGISDKTGSKAEDFLTASQAVSANADQAAMQDLAAADPAMAQKYAQDAQKGDGNAMVEDLVQAGNDAAASGTGGVFSNADAQELGASIGDYGKGKVNATEEQRFTAAFGADTLFRGSSAASKGFAKFENAVGGFMGQIVSPVTDGVSGMDKLVHGDVKGAFSAFGQAALGAVSDAAMVVAPEAAPEIELGTQAATTAVRAGVDGAEAGGGTAARGIDAANSALRRGSDVADGLNNASSLFGGGSSTPQTPQD